MNFDYLREFLDLASTLNFTRSASNLHITQSTLSRHIAAMEKELGFPLFTRSSNSVKLTQNGRLLYEKSHALIADYSDAITEMKENSAAHIETVNVTGSVIQPSVLRLFSRLSARAAFEVRPVRFEYRKVRSLSNEPPVPYPFDALHDGEVDFIIDPCEKGAKPPRGIDSMVICDEPISIIASTRNSLAAASGLRIEDMMSETLVTFAVQQHCSRILSSPFRAAGYSPQRIRTIFVDNMMEIPERLGTLAEDEIVVMQSSYCRLFGFDQCDPDNLTMLDVDDERMVTSVWAAWRKNDQADGVREAVRLMEEIVEDAKSRAAADQWSDADTLMAQAFYCE